MKTLLPILLLVISFHAYSQSIRKNYREMTQSEKDLVVSVFYQLREGPDIINDLATYHGINFETIHTNPPSSDVFLAWHRRQILELEQSMQAVNPKASIPFWDWRVDNSTSSALWAQNFMGSFNSNWSLGRALGATSRLPTAADVNSVQSISTFNSYYPSVENGFVHTGPHNWVGGAMQSGTSPRDPVFYLHHSMIDKLWQDWIDANNITPSSNIYQRTNMPRYDGTYVFNGRTLPSVNPDDIVNSRTALGVFYAENQLANLKEYTVTNRAQATETFYYQHTIVVGTNFTVPSGKNAKIESVNEVVFQPGFLADAGCNFIGKIDEDNNVITEKALDDLVDVKTNTFNFTNIPGVENAYGSNLKDFQQISVEVFPNPSYGLYTLDLSLSPCKGECSIEITDISGTIVATHYAGDVQRYNLDLTVFSAGAYMMNVKDTNGQIVTTEKLIKR